MGRQWENREAVSHQGGGQSFGNPESEQGCAPARNLPTPRLRWAVLRPPRRWQPSPELLCCQSIPWPQAQPGHAGWDLLSRAQRGRDPRGVCSWVLRVLSQSFVKPKHQSLLRTADSTPKNHHTDSYVHIREDEVGQEAGAGHSAQPVQGHRTSLLWVNHHASSWSATGTEKQHSLSF